MTSSASPPPCRAQTILEGLKERRETLAQTHGSLAKTSLASSQSLTALSSLKPPLAPPTPTSSKKTAESTRARDILLDMKRKRMAMSKTMLTTLSAAPASPSCLSLSTYIESEHTSPTTLTMATTVSWASTNNKQDSDHSVCISDLSNHSARVRQDKRLALSTSQTSKASLTQKRAEDLPKNFPSTAQNATSQSEVSALDALLRPSTAWDRPKKRDGSSSRNSIKGSMSTPLVPCEDLFQHMIKSESNRMLMMKSPPTSPFSGRIASDSDIRAPFHPQSMGKRRDGPITTTTTHSPESNNPYSKSPLISKFLEETKARKISADTRSRASAPVHSTYLENIHTEKKIKEKTKERRKSKRNIDTKSLASAPLISLRLEEEGNLQRDSGTINTTSKSKKKKSSKSRQSAQSLSTFLCEKSSKHQDFDTTTSRRKSKRKEDAKSRASAPLLQSCHEEEEFSHPDFQSRTKARSKSKRKDDAMSLASAPVLSTCFDQDEGFTQQDEERTKKRTKSKRKGEPKSPSSSLVQLKQLDGDIFTSTKYGRTGSRRTLERNDEDRRASTPPLSAYLDNSPSKDVNRTPITGDAATTTSYSDVTSTNVASHYVLPITPIPPRMIMNPKPKTGAINFSDYAQLVATHLQTPKVKVPKSDRKTKKRHQSKTGPVNLAEEAHPHLPGLYKIEEIVNSKVRVNQKSKLKRVLTDLPESVSVIMSSEGSLGDHASTAESVLSELTSPGFGIGKWKEGHQMICKLDTSITEWDAFPTASGQTVDVVDVATRWCGGMHHLATRSETSYQVVLVNKRDTTFTAWDGIHVDLSPMEDISNRWGGGMHHIATRTRAGWMEFFLEQEI